MCKFVRNWYCIETKLMRNFVQKHETVAQEKLLFREKPNSKPSQKKSLNFFENASLKLFKENI